MRIVSYSANGQGGAGVLTDAGVLDAAQLLGVDAVTVRQLLSESRVQELAERCASADAEPVSDPTLLPPVPDPQKIVCIGLNYRSHAEEAGLDPPAAPPIFAKFTNALVPDGAEVKLPAASDKVDYEAEVAMVIGRRCSEVSAAGAEEAIAGYMLLNDLSARDLQFLTPQWMPGKVFDGSAPCGPALVTADEAGHHDGITFSLDLNGERMQDGETSDLIFSMPELVEHLSRWMTLEPGDVIATGTPAGVGSVRDPSVWLKPGDQIEISSPQLGLLRTRIS
jgi:2-keto-4-pentenoate hydratase/2-oxohepta-3-ene-1,7-dioic acid hydratase in catechol pathway